MGDLIPQIELPLRVLIITPLLLLAFVGLVVWTYRRSGKRVFDDASRLPLED